MYLWVVSYDIADDKRRNKLAKLLLSYGERVQYSVFEFKLKEKELNSMLKQIAKEIDKEADSVRVYRLCAICQEKKVLKGKAVNFLEREDFVII